MNCVDVPNGVYSDVILLNGGWDVYNNKTPANMHNVQTEEFSSIFHLQDTGDRFRNNNGHNTNRDLVSPSPRGSDSGIESDCADGNLSWLLNYKIRELPPVPDSASTIDNLITESKLTNVPPPPPPTSPPQPPVQEVIINEGYKGLRQITNNSQRKPPFTYTELIEHALSEKGELTVSGIYNWISNHFPFYKANDDRWKNSVRHNLSINPHFRKGGKAIHGAGHLWTIAQRDEAKSWQMRQRINDFLKVSKLHQKTQLENEENFDKELQAATESILEEIQSHNSVVYMEPTQSILNTDKRMTEINDDIHVEFINMPEEVTGLEEFLTPPVSKQQIVNECGLGNDFFITDINPNQLGLNLSEQENNDDRIYEEMALEYYGIKD
ncbi:hypothetical protein ABEB36_012727 [Hypothenemus hampei]|uniref:Fork-head domain-containing protein n=1 Tax=Hypothenemus hampei TaxID=57062 RepID=A0ABD1EC78_HYPHA